MGDAGFFNGCRVQLVEGVVIETSPVTSEHATSTTLTADVLRNVFGRNWVIRQQAPITISKFSEPNPDITVVPGKIRDFKKAHPQTATLVIEIADVTLQYDRSQKASLYAKADIADYWIVNLLDEQVEVYRRPIADAAAEFGASYGDKLIFKSGDSVKPLAKPKAAIAVKDLLP
jgi:Uma2 family endonuclease